MPPNQPRHHHSLKLTGCASGALFRETALELVLKRDEKQKRRDQVEKSVDMTYISHTLYIAEFYGIAVSLLVCNKPCGDTAKLSDETKLELLGLF